MRFGTFISEQILILYLLRASCIHPVVTTGASGKLTYAIGMAAKLSGVNIETIRYYEREGIVPKAERAVNGRRTYDKDAISRLRFVKRCRELGFAIIDIRTLLKLSDQNAGTCDEVAKLSKANLESVAAKIDDLTRMKSALEELMTSCNSGQTECAMLKNLFADET